MGSYLALGTAYYSSVSCADPPAAPAPAACFHPSETVERLLVRPITAGAGWAETTAAEAEAAGGATEYVAVGAVAVGDWVKTADSRGHTRFSEIVALPHGTASTTSSSSDGEATTAAADSSSSSSAATTVYVVVTTADGRDIVATPDHIFPVFAAPGPGPGRRCALEGGRLTPARAIQTGQYLYVPAGAAAGGRCFEQVTSIREVNNACLLQPSRALILLPLVVTLTLFSPFLSSPPVPLGCVFVCAVRCGPQPPR